jgi:tetratricopeptide (TPR) repeat protein
MVLFAGRAARQDANVFILAEMNDVSAAVAALEAAIAREGASTARLSELAGLRLAAGDPEGAIAAYQQSIFAAPSPGLYNNLGTALVRAGRYPEAIAALETALSLQPGYLRALVNLGKALREVGRIGDAVSRLREALAQSPDYVPALINMGDALAAAHDLDAAQQTLELAVRLAPTRVEAQMALGIVYLQAGRMTESLAALYMAVRLAPDHAEAHANLAHALFVTGDWPAAWPHFAHRFQRLARRVTLHAPQDRVRWDGTLSPDLELWLLGEQGLGDQLQFSRYAKLLAGRGVRCVIACDPRIVGLLSLADLGARIVPLETSTDHPSARWFPLMSLPEWHRTRPDTVPFAQGYLAADPRCIDRWRIRLPRTQELVVALAWAGNPLMETGRYGGRSPPLAALAPLLQVPGVRFISLQKGPGEEQLDRAPFASEIMRLPELDAGPDAFLDTAAVLKCTDLLVTSDTAIAHLAGGLGVPTWLCLMHEPDWRWMRRGTSTPWYDSMRLFRQPAPGDWAGVYGEVAAALALRAPPR